ncbi:uncharacterized protein A4U43_C06F15550 [Asparagus officinalis]|uniref:Uncharacterized protein n=1 Tax=Asparagus officinalis TaxID=4686 RepID=A0A5P1EMD8_ASPOF|nr:uncharacterized protein A4U43_C06F15550 [Asparagus officinalis]
MDVERLPQASTKINEDNGVHLDESSSRESAEATRREGAEARVSAGIKDGRPIPSPGDEKYLSGVPDISLHHALHSYFIRGALLEKELYGRMEHVWGKYHKILKKVTILRANGGVDSG